MSPDPLVSGQPPRAPSGGSNGLSAAWGWTALGVVLAGALPFWPYAHACGWRLWLYSGAVLVLLIVGVRAALAAWRGVVGVAHTVALLVTLWALTLGAAVVLPRIGYARTRAGWVCRSVVAVPAVSPGGADSVRTAPPGGPPAPVGSAAAAGARGW